MKKKLSWTLIGNFSNSFSKWIILIIFINFLTTYDTGLYTFAFALTGPFILFANMRLRIIYVVSELENFNDYLVTRIITNICAMFIISLIAFIFYENYLYIIIMVAFIKSIELISDMLYAVLHRQNKFETIGKILLLKSLVTITAVLISTYLFSNIYISLVIYILVLITLLVIEYVYIKRYFTFKKIEGNEIKRILYAGVPLGLVQLVTSFTASLPVLFLEKTASIELIAVFSSINYLMVIATMFMSTISQVYLVNIKNKLELKDYKGLRNLIYNKLLKIGILFSFVGILFTSLLGSIFIEFIYGDVFAQYSGILVILSIAILFNFISWIADTVLMAMQYYKIQPIIAGIVFIIGLITTFLLVSQYSIYGAAYSLLIINILQAILKLVFSQITLYKKEAISLKE